MQCVEHPLNFTIMQGTEGSPDKRYPVEYTINPRDFFIPFKVLLCVHKIYIDEHPVAIY